VLGSLAAQWQFGDHSSDVQMDNVDYLKGLKIAPCSLNGDEEFLPQVERLHRTHRQAFYRVLLMLNPAVQLVCCLLNLNITIMYSIRQLYLYTHRTERSLTDN